MKNNIIKSLFEDDYVYSPIIYNLLKENKLNYYINKLEDSNLYITDSNGNKIKTYKQFLVYIDSFIDFLYCSLNITNVQLIQILLLIFDNLKNPVFLSKHSIKDNKNIHILTNEYKKIILTPFKKNLKFIRKRIDFNISFDINNDNLLFNLLIDLCNIRKNHQYILFDDFKEYKNNPGKLKFYLLMWELAIKTTKL